MSAQPIRNELDPKRLVEAIVEKTKAGKLNWEETAAENVFIASVGGDTTFKVSSETRGERLIRTGEVPTFFYDDTEMKKLTLLNEYGKPLVEVWQDEDPAVGELFDLARRTALNVDERVKSVIEVLQKL